MKAENKDYTRVDVHTWANKDGKDGSINFMRVIPEDVNHDLRVLLLLISEKYEELRENLINGQYKTADLDKVAILTYIDVVKEIHGITLLFDGVKLVYQPVTAYTDGDEPMFPYILTAAEYKTEER